MGLFNLDKIFRPQSIAVIGAGDKPGTIGRALMHNLTRGGFDGELWPVNPNYAEIFGLKAYGTIGEIGSPVDLAVIATPMATVPDLVAACGAQKVGGAIVISAGGKEIGVNGKDHHWFLRPKDVSPQPDCLAQYSRQRSIGLLLIDFILGLSAVIQSLPFRADSNVDTGTALVATLLLFIYKFSDCLEIP
jgi:hypothetical protein